MRWVLLALLAAAPLVWFARPFSVDLLRYGAWRAAEGRAFVNGSIVKVRAALVRGDIGKAVPGRLLRAALSPEPGRRQGLVANIRSLWRNQPALDAADLRAIGTPTLIIAGSEDDIRRGHLDDIVREMPDATLAVLPGVGHAVPQSTPDQVLELMTDFLDRAGDTRAPDGASRSASS